MSKTNGQLARSVSIIGVGYTPLGNVLKSPEIKDLTERELFSWAAFEAMDDAGIEAKDIDACYLGQVAPGRFSNLLAGATAMADWVGMRNKPTISHDEACSTSNVGLGYVKYEARTSEIETAALTTQRRIYLPFVLRSSP